MSSGQPTSPAGVNVYRESEDVGRDLAIPAIGQAPWGTHFCQFYDTKQDLLDTLVPYFRAGLEGNEKCLWVTSDPVGVDEAAEALSREIEDFERRVDLGQMTILSYTDWYRDRERIDPERYIEPIVPGIREALTQGYGGLRVSGSASWLPARQWEPFMVYESALGQRFVDWRLISLCAYPLVMCDSFKMIDVLMRHRFALIKHEDWTLIEPSEQKQATAAVERMNRALTERTTQLQAALAELRGFHRWATDDLRVPLRHIRSFSDRLTVGSLDEDERRLAERIQASADRMGVLIADIQAYSAAQQSPLYLRPLDLEALTCNVWMTLVGVVEGHQVGLEIRPLPRAYGDRAMLTRVLAGLLSNAIKFTGKRREAHVEVGALTMDGECVYYVRDNGIGFAPVYVEKVFEPFERLHGRGEFEGSGLGLATAKQIITRHGGRVWAESVPRVGATFYFTLPEPGHVVPT
jgi:signal transduction histidine kinase